MSTWTARPNLFLVGVMKAGTTTIYDALRQHPDVYMTPVKEPNYLAWGDRPLAFTGPGDEETVRLSFTRESSYAALFAWHDGERLVGEASTSSLGSERATERILAMAPDASILIILRDPVDRAYATYRRLCLVGRERLRTFEEALAAEDARLAAGWEPIWAYAQSGRYAEHIERHLRCFPAGRVHVLFYDDLAADPSRTVRRLYARLGVDDTFRPDLRRRYNRSAGLASPAGPLTGATARSLRDCYADDLARLVELIGPVPSSWPQVRSCPS